MAGAPPVSWAGLRVVKAATELTSGQKLVWLEIWGLASKSPDRAYMSAVNIGRRLAMGCDNVEKARRELKRAGLLGSAPRPDRREASWWPILPAGCIPSSERPGDDEVFSLAALLDDQIRCSRSGAEADQGTPVPPEERGTTRQREAYHSTPPPTRRGGAIRPLQDLLPEVNSGVPQSASTVAPTGVLQSASEGGKGGDSTLSSSTLPEVGTTPPPSTPPSEAGLKVGPFAHERDEVGAKPDSQPAAIDWRDVLEPPAANPSTSISDRLRAERRIIDEEFRTAGDRR